MRARIRVGGPWGVVVLAGLACGCNGQDADRLAQIGRLSAARGEELTRGVRERLVRGWAAIQAGSAVAAVDGRVSSRIGWDKSMAGVDIQVSSPSSGVVVLRGSAPDESRRQRAAELAQSTDGVDRVVNEITVPTAAPQ
jgi:osmotically-inducible protein OsmY